ncbi:MAG: prepilin-type N-terminal cleavage/methylation domain-containing protein [Patescibacteria group bacterium]|nr:prepilin-type N-terminal cleavage/methylation domain-containing protein [Patescibacteria group bacterium]
MKPFKQNKKQKAYTLIEVLIAVAIFFTVIAGPTGLFILSLKSQNRILGSREILDNSSHVLEYMSRALRMAKKELNCGDRWEPETCFCLKDNGYGFNYEITYQGKGIKFNNAQDPSICQEFFWDTIDNRLKESKDGAGAVPLTSDDLEVVLFKFKEFGFTQSDNIQPRVVIFLEMRKKNELESPKIKIQTTISQRKLDVMY